MELVKTIYTILKENKFQISPELKYSSKNGCFYFRFYDRDIYIQKTLNDNNMYICYFYGRQHIINSNLELDWVDTFLKSLLLAFFNDNDWTLNDDGYLYTNKGKTKIEGFGKIIVNRISKEVKLNIVSGLCIEISLIPALKKDYSDFTFICQNDNQIKVCEVEGLKCKRG